MDFSCPLLYRHSLTLGSILAVAAAMAAFSSASDANCGAGAEGTGEGVGDGRREDVLVLTEGFESAKGSNEALAFPAPPLL